MNTRKNAAANIDPQILDVIKPSRTRNRQPVKPLAPSPAAVAAAAKVEKERKAASKAALRAATKPAKPVKAEPVLTQADTPTVAPEFLATLREDAIALGHLTEEAIEAYVVEQTAAPKKQKYTGPMLALVAARKAYRVAANGNPNCGDDLGQVCGEYSRETVVKALIAALGLPSNPYAHLNPGQQSMNLRNKARTAIKNGTLKMADVQLNLVTQSALAHLAK